MQRFLWQPPSQHEFSSESYHHFRIREIFVLLRRHASVSRQWPSLDAKVIITASCFVCLLHAHHAMRAWFTKPKAATPMLLQSQFVDAYCVFQNRCRLGCNYCPLWLHWQRKGTSANTFELAKCSATRISIRTGALMMAQRLLHNEHTSVHTSMEPRSCF